MNFLSSFFYLSILFIWKFSEQIPPEKDLISTLPGYNGKIPIMYTGFLPVNSGESYLHYIFVQAYNNHKTAPITLWIQGGPGSSSLIGLFTEIGPFLINQYSITENNEAIQLLKNKYSWTKNVNFLFLDSPAGVGYSYCDKNCPIYNDEIVAEENFEFLLKFFEKFPEYKSNDFYIAGENYSGIFIPILANLILTKPNNIKFEGILIGNGCMGLNSTGGCSHYDSQFMVDYLYQHGQISTLLYNEIKKNCESKDLSEKCHKYIYKILYEAGQFSKFNIYDECPYKEDFKLIPVIEKGDFPCYSISTLTSWINSEETKNIFLSNQIWSPFNNKKDFFVPTTSEIFPYYEKIINSGKKILIYFGDIDLNVSLNSGLAWVESHGFIKIKDWRPWTLSVHNVPWLQYNSLVAGYIMQYKNEFTFVTVKGSGHFVPQNKPEQAFELFENFIFNRPFNIYTPT